jgi:galactose mutarotase-like enzyme
MDRDEGRAVDTIALRAGDTEALLAPGAGANCLACRVGGRDIIEPVPSPAAALAEPTRWGCPILFPFPGRLPGGRYSIAGQEYHLPLTAPDGRTHLHGFAPRRPWRVAHQDEGSCVCAFDRASLASEEAAAYPWPFRLTVRWSVQPGLLRADVRVENPGDDALPFGFGLHPYLAVAEDAVARVPATHAWPNQGGIPVGSPDPISGPWAWAALEPGASVLLTGLPRTTVEATVGDTVLRFPGDRLGEVVLYRPPDRPAVCIEPWTSVSGAGVSLAPGAPHGLVNLPPGETWEAWLELRGGGGGVRG